MSARTTSAIRIGAFQPVEKATEEGAIALMDGFVSHSDTNQLLAQSVDAENLRFAIFHGLSDNRFKRLDISSARELVSYDPQDDVAQLNPILKETGIADKVMTHSNIADGGPSGLRNDA